MRKLILVSSAAVVLCFGVYELGGWRELIAVTRSAFKEERVIAQEVPDSRQGHPDSLSALDAHGFKGIQEISRPELVRLMANSRSLSPDESTNLDRGCLGLTCVYQSLGLRRWPELARGTIAYLRREDALNRPCPNGQQNFIFLKQGWWLERNPPTPDPFTGEVPLDSVTRIKIGFYTFNYAVYFPSTETYAWMNHRDYGFPVNLISPQKAYLSSVPPPLDAARPAQIYCSTCR
jgi:hypothetical protein